MSEAVEPMKFDANTLARGWQSVALAKSGDDARPILTGMLVEFYPAGVQLVATDSYMLFRSWVPTLGEDSPAPGLDEAPTSTAIALDHHGLVVGKLEGERLTLNLGWCAAAGLGVTVQDDPAVDHHRGGVVLER